MTENFSDQKNNYKINSKANSPQDTTPIWINGKQVDADSIRPIQQKTKIAYKKSPGADATPIRFNTTVKGAPLKNVPKHLSDSSSSSAAETSVSEKESPKIQEIKKSQDKSIDKNSDSKLIKKSQGYEEKKSPEVKKSPTPEVKKSPDTKKSPSLTEIKKSPIVNTLPSLVANPISKDTEKIPMKTKNIPKKHLDESNSRSSKDTPYAIQGSQDAAESEDSDDETSISIQPKTSQTKMSEQKSSKASQSKASQSKASQSNLEMSRSLTVSRSDQDRPPKRKGKIDYNLLSPEEQAEKRIEFRYKLGILRKAHKNFTIPDIEEHEDLNIVARKYSKYLEKTSITENLGKYKGYLLVGSLLIERLGIDALGLNFSGFAYRKFLNHNRYDSILYELGEKNYSNRKSNWPVEIRLCGMFLTEAVIFIAVKYLSASFSFDPEKAKFIEDLIFEQFSNGNSAGADEAQDDDGPTFGGINMSSLIRTFGKTVSNPDAGKTEPQQPRRRPVFRE